MKYHDWQLRFEAFLAARRAMPFAWGSNDCAIFATDCVLALTGRDVALPELRLHINAKQALAAIKSHGGLGSIATAALGQPVPVLLAQIGDVVLCKSGKRDMLAICNGGTAIAPGRAGMVSVSMDAAALCWRVA